MPVPASPRERRTEVIRVDAHHHLWDPALAGYPWMTEERAVLRRRFGPEHLEPQLNATGVRRTVVVQARSDLEETERLLRLAAAVPFIAGVVGWVDLTSPDVRTTLRRLRALGEGRYLVGVRHQVEDEPDPAWLRRADVRRGLLAVAEAALVYDLLIVPQQIPAAVATARELPQLRFVLDHLGKPRIAARRDSEWSRAMAGFAECRNVACKLSGMVSQAGPGPLQAEDLAPFVDRARALFGDSRLLFGSDWPVCTLHASYDRVLELLRETLRLVGLPEDGPVLGENAVDVYGLGAT